ncbi:hypothetical protein FO519_009134 [Halicephalobus sp. NKZ332]|nr:hypothetical protein FO519_009134 [Halicephalobus sp. NKZ332]
MDSFIVVHGNGKDVKVAVESSGVINEDTLRHAFLLEQDVPVGLFRNEIALKSHREGDNSFFDLGDGWKGADFKMMWDEERHSRPATPIAIESRPTTSDQADEIVELMKKYVYKVDGILACATAVGANVLASCYHCVKHCVATGPSLDEINCHREAVIYLTHAVTGRKIKAKILVYSIEKDVALLQTMEEEKLMVDGEITFKDAWFGQPYYLLGTPISDDGNPLQVISGRISSILQHTLATTYVHSLHGHGSARPGASGGPVFARYLTDGKPTLLGIVISGQNITHETTLVLMLFVIVENAKQ